MAVERPGQQRPDPRTRGALVGPGAAPGAPAEEPAGRLAGRVVRCWPRPSWPPGGAWLVAEEVARGAALLGPARVGGVALRHRPAGRLPPPPGPAAVGRRGVGAPALEAGPASGPRRRARGAPSAASFVTLVVGLLPVLAARCALRRAVPALLVGLASRRRPRAVAPAGRPPARPAGWLHAPGRARRRRAGAPLAAVLPRRGGGQGGARARGPVAPYGAARRSPAGRPLGPPAPFAKGVVRPGQAPQLPALRGASLPGLTPSSSFAPAGYLTLTEAARRSGWGGSGCWRPPGGGRCPRRGPEGAGRPRGCSAPRTSPGTWPRAPTTLSTVPAAPRAPGAPGPGALPAAPAPPVLVGRYGSATDGDGGPTPRARVGGAAR